MFCNTPEYLYFCARSGWKMILENCKMFSFDISYSVILPVSPGDFLTQWEDCLKQLQTQAEESRYRIFKINIFVHSTDKSNFLTKKEFINDTVLKAFGDECPTFGILPISPEQHFDIEIELSRVMSSGVIINFRKYENIGYTTLEKDGYKELWANGIEDTKSISDTKNSASLAFNLMRNILLSEDMTFDNIVRQWNYIGSILNTKRRKLIISQNYQVFNKVRFDNYSGYRQIPGFPAATGVGMNYRGVVIDFCAIRANDNIQIISVKNPRQINPYNYDQNILIGSPTLRQENKQPPLFERAKLLTYNGKWRIFVSGTASIIGQETIGIGDVEKQTLVSIENIEKLICIENLVNNCPNLFFKTPNKYNHIRVYVKNAGDISLVKSICTNHFDNIPAIYLQADICRNDLLVEIEAEAISQENL